MPRLQPKPLELTLTERQTLEQLVRKHKTPQRLALRARIILLADEGLGHRAIGRALGVGRIVARAWRHRWLELAGRDMPVLERLVDAPRSGRPSTFTTEQITHLHALACEDPRESDRPISHWTPRELADEMIIREIVPSISPRHVGRLLAKADLKPHQIRYWLTSPNDDQFEAKVADICETYLTAPERAKKGSAPSALTR